MNSHVALWRLFDRKILTCRPAMFMSFLGPWAYAVQSSTIAVSHRWVNSSGQVADATVELNKLISFQLWLVATIVDGTGQDNAFFSETEPPLGQWKNWGNRQEGLPGGNAVLVVKANWKAVACGVKAQVLGPR